MNCGQPQSQGTQIDDARLSHIAAAAPAPLVEKMRSFAYLVGERRVVTALFVDVVDSSALAEQVNVQDWAAIMNDTIDRCVAAIYRYEGTIARSLGDELLAFFGAPIAHEDDPLRAVRAAIDLLDEMHEYAQEIRRKHGIEFAVRVSLSTGPVTVGPVGNDLEYEYSALGGPINLAAHVESIKWPMKVLITETTYRLVAPFFDCVDLGSIEIKGQTEQMHVYQVRGPKVQADQERGLAGLTSPMVGRDAELQSLLRLGEAVQAGLGRAVLIAGEPGLGKTHLIAEWKAADAAAFPEASLQWVTGHCSSHARERPYRLLLDLLRSVLGIPAAAREPTTRAALLALTQDLFDATGHHASGTGAPDTASDERDPAQALDVYAVLGHLLSLKLDGPALERVQHLDPQALQARYLTALRQLLQALTARRPLVLILENLHWADPSSVELLIRMLPLATITPLLFCLVTRPDRDVPGWKLVTAVREALGRSLAEIALAPLSETLSQQLITNLLEPEALPEQIRTLILEATEGNPLFIKEVIRMLIDRGAILQRDGTWVAGTELDAVEIPGSLQGLLLARIDRLPDEVKHCLRVASVIGRQFSVKVLEQVLSQDERGMKLTRHLGALESAGMVHLAQVMPELAYRFTNALIQDAAYTSILITDRQSVHLAVAETLEALYPEQLTFREFAPMLAWHFSRADSSQPQAGQRALKYFAIAGKAALASYANQEAERHYQSALALAQELARSDTDRADLLSRLGEALYWQSRFQDAIQVWHEGIELYQGPENSDSRARLYARSARAIWSSGDTPGALGLCQEGLAAAAGAPESPGLALLMHEAARAFLFNGLPDKARPLCQRALTMAERLGIVEEQIEALATLGLLPGQSTEARLEALTRAVELAESAQLLNQAARAHVNLAATMLTATADFRAALRHYQYAAQLNRQRGNTASELLSLCGVADLGLKLGDLKSVEAAFQVMRSLLSKLANPGPATFMFRITEAALLRHRGELAEAARLLRNLQADARQRQDLHNLIDIDNQLADILLESPVLTGGTRADGLPEAVATEIETALLENIQICQSRSLSDVYPRCLLSEARAGQGRLQEARSLLAEARETAASQPVAWEEVWLSWAEARVAIVQESWEGALSALETAAGICSRLEMRWWWARTLQEWAQVHASRGKPTDLARARALFREAQAMFEELDVGRYAALVEKSLQQVNAAIHVEMLAHDETAQELASAARIQASFLPAEPPRVSGWQMTVTLKPARETSGDFYDFIPLPDGRWGLVIADVAGKGVGAALYMALGRTLIRTYAAEYSAQPELIFSEVSKRMLAETHGDMFITVFYGILEPSAGTLTYCNAGHNPPYLLCAQKGGTLAQVQTLRRTGLPLGILEDAAWEQKAIQIDPGGVLVLYTDGVTDAHDAQKELFGAGRVLETIQANLGRSARDIEEALLSEVRTFVGSAPQFDDITLMVVARGP